MIKTVCIFCGSSPSVDSAFLDAAAETGKLLALSGIHVKYGCGAAGLMGAMAKGVLDNKGKITGIIPAFMVDMGWSNSNISTTLVTHDMRERKRLMISNVDAVIALPGGIGTLEELMEVITLKQLGRFNKPIIILNTQDFYNNLLVFLDDMVNKQFMREIHKKLWTVVDSPSEIISAILDNTGWNPDEIKYATNI